MDMLFLKVLNMSISASWLVLMVLALRFVLKKAPRWLHVCLWALVAVRLVCPVSIESVLSLIPSAETVPEGIFYMEPRQHDQNATLKIVEERPNVESVDVELDMTVGVAQTKQIQWVLLWPAGMTVMLVYAAISYLRLKGKVSASIHLDNGVCICDYIDTPFILGILKPVIYLPSAMEPTSASHVLAHERAHIRRKDHWWKPLGFALLTMHWFNPVMWLAYILLCRDIELACDEKVIREMNAVDKKAYSEALLSCSVPRHMIAACPLAFGEVGVKERVKTVLNYKKPAFWIILVAVIALIVTAVCFLTDPKTEEPFGNSYQVEEVTYHPASTVHPAPVEAPLFELTKDMELKALEDKSSDNWLTPGTFEETVLTVENFDNLTDVYRENWAGDTKALTLRMNCEKAWVLYVNDPANTVSTLFYYLLRQNSGEVYLAMGYQWKTADASTIFRIYKLTEPENEEPYAQADTPHQWTRNVTLANVEWVSATTYDAEGIPSSFNVQGRMTEQLLAILNNIPAGAIEPGTPVGNLESSVYIACNNGGEWDASLDFLLRYSDGEVDINFGAENSRYPELHNQTWRIHDQSLIDYMANLPIPWEETNPLAPADTPYQWTSHVSSGDFVFGSVFLSEQFSYSRSITGSDLEEVVSLLNQVQETEIVVRPWDEAGWNINSTRINLAHEDYLNDSVSLQLADDVVKLTFSDAIEEGYPEIDGYWAIENEALVRWMERLAYGGTWMLTDEDRQEVYRQLNPMDSAAVTFFDPQIYEDLLFVGCIYGDDDQTALAVFREDGQGGYDLQRVTPYDWLNTCPSGANMWWDDYTTEELNLYIFLIRNTYVSKMEWLGDFEATIPIDNKPAVVVVDVPKDAKTEYRFVYSGSNTTMPSTVTEGVTIAEVAEYTHHYANMKVPRLEGWEYELVEYTDEYTGFGIRFRPEGEAGWLFLQFSPSGFAVCGTGLEGVSGTMSNGYITEHGYYDGNDIWSFIRITDMPGSYTVVNEGADTWIPEYEADIQTILEHMVVAEGCLDMGQIQHFALQYAQEQGWNESADGGEGVTYDTRFSYESGIWSITMRKMGSAPFEVQLDIHGQVLNEE